MARSEERAAFRQTTALLVRCQVHNTTLQRATHCDVVGSKPTGGTKGRQGGTQREGAGLGLAGDSDGDDKHQPVQQCKEEFCLAHEGRLEALIEKRQVFTMKNVETTCTGVLGPEVIESLATPTASYERLKTASNSTVSMGQQCCSFSHTNPWEIPAISPLLFEPCRQKCMRKSAFDSQRVRRYFHGNLAVEHGFLCLLFATEEQCKKHRSGPGEEKPRPVPGQLFQRQHETTSKKR